MKMDQGKITQIIFDPERLIAKSMPFVTIAKGHVDIIIKKSLYELAQKYADNAGTPICIGYHTTQKEWVIASPLDQDEINGLQYTHTIHPIYVANKE